MRSILFLATSLAALAAADSTTTVSHFGINLGLEWPVATSYAASVAGINAEATPYEINCLDNAPSTDCQISPPWTLIQGSNTYADSGWSGTAGDYGCTFGSGCRFCYCCAVLSVLRMA